MPGLEPFPELVRIIPNADPQGGNCNLLIGGVGKAGGSGTEVEVERDSNVHVACLFVCCKKKQCQVDAKRDTVRGEVVLDKSCFLCSGSAPGSSIAWRMKAPQPDVHGRSS